MRQDIIKNLLKETAIVNKLRDAENKIIAKSKGMRQRQVKPMADELEKMQNKAQDNLLEDIKPELDAILTKLGYDTEPEYLKESITNVITFHMITMMETHVVQLRSTSLTDDQRKEVARLLKESE